MEVVVDKIGQEIKPGCLIVYGHAFGRCAALRIGKVLGVETAELDCWGIRRPCYRITVRGVHDGWNGEGHSLTSRNGVLLYPDRIVVLNAADVPQSYRALLDPLPVL